MENKSKFVSLKRVLPILLILLFTGLCSQGQGSRIPSGDGNDKVLKLYPNPATTYITFDFQKEHEKGFSIQVFSFLGRKMYESQNVNPRTTIDLAEYNRGVYIYHLRDQSGKLIESGKFQVSK